MTMGIGSFLQNQANIKRKYRWSLAFGKAADAGGGFSKEIRPIMVSIAARPSLTIEETELNFMNEKDFIPAKPTWDPLSVTFLDYAKVGGGGADQALEEWIRSNYWYGAPAMSGAMSDPVGQARRTGTLTLYNGVGTPLEEWTLYGAWVQIANWGDLDYSSTDNATIEATVRFQNADFQTFAGAVGKAIGGDNSGMAGG